MKTLPKPSEPKTWQFPQEGEPQCRHTNIVVLNYRTPKGISNFGKPHLLAMVSHFQSLQWMADRVTHKSCGTSACEVLEIQTLNPKKVAVLCYKSSRSFSQSCSHRQNNSRHCSSRRSSSSRDSSSSRSRRGGEGVGSTTSSNRRRCICCGSTDKCCGRSSSCSSAVAALSVTSAF